LAALSIGLAGQIGFALTPLLVGQRTVTA
jgi:hypothetical protein